jgi:hypothetical protein
MSRKDVAATNSEGKSFENKEKSRIWTPGFALLKVANIRKHKAEI